MQWGNRETDKYLPEEWFQYEDPLQNVLAERQYLVSAYQEGIVEPADLRLVESRIWEIDGLAEEILLGRLGDQYEAATSSMYRGLGCATIGDAEIPDQRGKGTDGGGRYVVFWGAVVFGLLQALAAWSSRRNAARKLTEILRSRQASPSKP